MFEREASNASLEAEILAYEQELEHQEVWRELAEAEEASNADTLAAHGRLYDTIIAHTGIDRLCCDCGHPLHTRERSCPRCKRGVCVGCGE